MNLEPWLLNPLENPQFIPTSIRVIYFLVFGFGIVLFFARKDIKAGLKGELGQRFISWMIIAPIFLIASFIGGFAGAIIVIYFFYRVVKEYVEVMNVQQTYARYLYALIPVTFIVAEWAPDFYFALPAASILLFTLIPILSGKVDDLFNQLSYGVRGYLYLIWSIAHLVLMKDIVSKGMLVMVGVGIALSDVMQYTVGKLIGKHIISPNVNPRKAWEGLIGDFLGAGLAVWVFNFTFSAEFTLIHKIILVFLIGIGTAWGDLISSMIKRSADVKDWGDLLPGHGGMLDRANSLVVALPMAYYFFKIVLDYT